MFGITAIFANIIHRQQSNRYGKIGSEDERKADRERERKGSRWCDLCEKYTVRKWSYKLEKVMGSWFFDKITNVMELKLINCCNFPHSHQHTYSIVVARIPISDLDLNLILFVWISYKYRMGFSQPLSCFVISIKLLSHHIVSILLLYSEENLIEISYFDLPQIQIWTMFLKWASEFVGITSDAFEKWYGNYYT